MGNPHRPRARRSVLAALLALAAASPGVRAQATAPVPLEERSYELLDRLSAQLAPGTLAHDQRPYTRLQVARFTLQMREALEQLTALQPAPSTARLGYLGELVSALEQRYADEIALLSRSAAGAPVGSQQRGAHLDVVRADGSWADSPFRGFTWNGLGSADNAQMNPLLDYDFGRPWVDGASAALDLQGRIDTGRLVAFGGPRFALQAPRGGVDTEVGLSLATGAARVRAGRWGFQVGRAQVRRGQGRQAGLLFSDNTPPLDMVFVENEEPYQLPWLFRYLGPLHFSALFSDLGPEQNFPHAKLYSNWLTFRPADHVEVGGGFIVHDGGKGSPQESIWERVGDYLLFVDVLFQAGSDFQASNKIAALDFRWWVPGGAAVLYGELAIDDFRVFNWNHVREMLWPDAAHVAGVVLPRLDGVGKLSGWAEFQHTGIRIYRHYDFSSGLTRRRFLLGDGMGSDGHALVAGLDFGPSPSSTLSLEGAWEQLSHDEWTAPEDPYFHFEKVTDGIEERRLRARLAWDHRPLDSSLGWRVEAGLERVQNFGFQPGEPRTNGALQLGLEWAP